MGREIKRVDLKFKWPLNKVWKGYVNPHYTAKECSSCGGFGYSPDAKRFKDEWYGYVYFDPYSTGSEPFAWNHHGVYAFAKRNIENSPAFYLRGCSSTKEAIWKEAERLAELWNKQWSHHLSQADVDALVAADRLWDFTRTPRTDEQMEIVRKKLEAGGNCWLPESNGYTPNAKQVNDWSLQGMGHDSINAGVCIKARCEREGKECLCDKCKGHGLIWPSKEAEKKYDEWKKQEPPAGEGWQMWETVSEGSPITPVFSSAENLAQWCLQNRDEADTFEQWMKFIEAGWAPSAVSVGGEFMNGVEAVGK